MDRRRQTRYPLKISAEIQAFGKLPLPEPLQTVTHDISGSGLFLECEQPLKAGTRLVLQLRLPREATRQEVSVCCVARVVRVTSKDGRTGVAAQIEKYEFVRHGDDSRAATAP